jgi:hypothetical protein
MTARDILRARVLLHLEAGKTYNEALHLATAPLPVLGVRTQPQSPAHAVKA